MSVSMGERRWRNLAGRPAGPRRVAVDIGTAVLTLLLEGALWFLVGVRLAFESWHDTDYAIELASKRELLAWTLGCAGAVLLLGCLAVFLRARVTAWTHAALAGGLIVVAANLPRR